MDMQYWAPAPMYLKDAEDYWPRRLLHIPTMTSHERSGDGKYGDCQYPKYNILSYTWGRWHVRDYDPMHPYIHVHGTSWAIPRIDEAHFTATAFYKVVQRMMQPQQGIEWAWIDVACIDQENDAVKMDEVGRQASIFKKASRAFVWLSQSHSLELADAFRTIGDLACVSLGDTINGKHQTGACPALRQIYSSATKILEDPWFTSLWTLQELFMRHDALFLSKTGETITGWTLSNPNRPMFVETLLGLFHNLFEEMNDVRMATFDGHSNINTAPAEEAQAISTVRQLSVIITELLDRSGLSAVEPFSDNPNIQYGAAKFRMTTNPEDRVYAIMQIYNLRVGQSIRPDDQPSLAKLIGEFGLAINANSALLGQLFVHTNTEMELGYPYWCITEASRVPPWCSLIAKQRSTSDQDRQVTSKIYKETSSSSVAAKGHFCKFHDFYGICLAALTDTSSVGMSLKDIMSVNIYLDQQFRSEVETHDSFLHLRHYEMRERRHGLDHIWREYGACLCENYGSKRNGLVIMLLGEEPAVGIWVAEGPRLPQRRHFGLILRSIGSVPLLPETTETPTIRGTYQRLGICVWTMAWSLSDTLVGQGEGLEKVKRRLALETEHPLKDGTSNMSWEDLWVASESFTWNVIRLWTQPVEIKLC